LHRIEQAETFLASLGFTELRVRSHERDLARIEVRRDQVPLLTGEHRARIVKRLRDLGFRYVTIDLEGFRSGNLNG
jgi:uncharacterized protein